MQVFRDAHVFGQWIVLRQITDMPFNFVRTARHGDATDLHASSGRRQIAGEDPHGGTFARTIGPQKSHDFPTPYGEADVVDGCRACVGLYKVFDLDGRSFISLGGFGHQVRRGFGRNRQ